MSPGSSHKEHRPLCCPSASFLASWLCTQQKRPSQLLVCSSQGPGNHSLQEQILRAACLAIQERFTMIDQPLSNRHTACGRKGHATILLP